MELKLFKFWFYKREKNCLNRTFYGIETSICRAKELVLPCLNRTFYGIETTERYNIREGK